AATSPAGPPSRVHSGVPWSGSSAVEVTVGAPATAAPGARSASSTETTSGTPATTGTATAVGTSLRHTWTPSGSRYAVTDPPSFTGRSGRWTNRCVSVRAASPPGRVRTGVSRGACSTAGGRAPLASASTSATAAAGHHPGRREAAHGLAAGRGRHGPGASGPSVPGRSCPTSPRSMVLVILSRYRRVRRPTCRDDRRVHAVGHPVRDRHVHPGEPRGGQPLDVLRPRQRARDAGGPLSTLGALRGGQGVVGDDVGHADPPARPQHPEHLGEDRRLVHRQIDDAVGDD